MLMAAASAVKAVYGIKRYWEWSCFIWPRA
jgi:hypothetical protein